MTLIKVVKAIKEIIKEDHELWGDIAFQVGKYRVPAGYNKMTPLTETDIYVIASGLIRKGVIND